MSHVATLGESQGPGMLDFGSLYAIRDKLGRYWLAQQGRILVFDSHGSPLAIVGSAGGGPMEFERPRPFHVDEAGNVYVVDNGNARLSIIDSDFRLVREQRLPGFVSDLVFLDDEDRYVAVMTHRTPTGLGLPMHLVESGTVETSFGRTEPGVVHVLDNQVLVTPDGSGGLVSVPAYEYRIDAWTERPELRWTQIGPPLNDHEVKGGLIRPDNPPPTRIIDIAVDGAFLFVLVWQPTADWRNQVVEVVRPDGTVAYQPVDDLMAGLYESRVDVIRLDESEMVASQVLDRLFVRFLDHGGFLLSNYLTEVGEPRVDVFSLTLEAR